MQKLRRSIKFQGAIANTTPALTPAAPLLCRQVLAPAENLCAITDAGRTRDYNEDRIHAAADCTLMIVADGMGGHTAGALAAQIAVESVIESLTALPGAQTEIAPDAIRHLLLDAMNLAQQRVTAASATRQGGLMGCTLILGFVHCGTIYTAHVGDARAYLTSGGQFRQITRDHSLVGELIAAGELTNDEARVHPRKNEIFQALGMPGGLAPDINAVPLNPGDRFLLCSDGLWEMLSQFEIATSMAGEGSIRQLATHLVDRANASGGRDNVSVILFEQLAPTRNAT